MGEGVLVGDFAIWLVKYPTRNYQQLCSFIIILQISSNLINFRCQIIIQFTYHQNNHNLINFLQSSLILFQTSFPTQRGYPSPNIPYQPVKPQSQLGKGSLSDILQNSIKGSLAGNQQSYQMQSKFMCELLAQQHIDKYIQNSGHFFAQMGSYYDCVQLPFNSSYFMANFINNKTHAPASLYMGLCLPEVCTGQDVMQVMNKQLQNQDVKKAIIAITRMELAVGTVDVNPQNYAYDKTGWFYFTITMIILLAVLGLISLFRSMRSKKKEKYSPIDKILQTFNYAQSLKIFTYKQNYLNIFNGIKAICMFWVIFGHLFSVRLKYNANIAGIPSIVQEFFFVFVTGAFLAVDVFFFIGGFLVAYSFMRQKSKSILKYPMAIVHRVLRFWPSYIMTILLYYAVYIHTGDGPLWKQNMTLGQIPFCSGAWKTILFVDNLVDNGEQMCMGWGWYLQNDMQIFVFSLIFIFVYTKNRIAGYLMMIAMICVGVSLNIYEVVRRDIKQVTHLIDFIKWGEYFTNIYIKPWIRCPPYLLGLVLGLQHMEYLEVKKKLKENPEDAALQRNFFVRLKKQMEQKRWMVWVSFILALFLMLLTICLPHNLQVGNTWPEWAHGVYLSLEKLSFTFGIYLLIIPTLLDIPNLAFFLLDTKFFNFISKISFWVYLIHFMIVEEFCYDQKVDFYYTAQTIVPLYVSIAMLSLFFGFLGTMLVEVPFSKLEKMLFSVFMAKKERPPKITNNLESIIAGNASIVQGSSSIIGNASIVSNAGAGSLITSDSVSPLEQKLLRQ